MIPKSNFTNRINYIINKIKIPKQEIAKNANISKSLLSKYLSGDCHAGNVKLARLAKALNVDPLWLMGFGNDDDYNLINYSKKLEECISKVKLLDETQLDKLLIIIDTMF